MPFYFYSNADNEVIAYSAKRPNEPDEPLFDAKNYQDAIELYQNLRDLVKNKPYIIEKRNVETLMASCVFCKHKFRVSIEKNVETQLSCPSCGSLSVPFKNNIPHGWNVNKECKVPYPKF